MGHATTPISTGLSEALTKHARALAKRASVASNGHVDPVRRARVASRRLREVLGIVDDAAVHIGMRHVERDAKRVTRALGPVREIDVAIDELQRAAKRHHWPPEVAAAIQRRLDRQRDRRRRPMLRAMQKFDGKALANRCGRIAKAMGRHGTEHAWWIAIAKRVQQRAALVRTAIAECGTLYAPDRLHALRIAIKKLRYALEFVRGTRGIDVDATVRALKDAQRRFGHLHDMQILLAEIADLTVNSRAWEKPDLVKVIDALERDCRKIHARILPYLPVLRTQVDAARRDVGARLGGRRLPMAKAQVKSAVDPIDAAAENSAELPPRSGVR